MIIIWRGWGPLALFVLVPCLAVCAGLMDVVPLLVLVAIQFATLYAGGVLCAYCGQRWNQPVEQHSLYFIPLQVWGWLYLLFSAGMALLALAGGIAKRLRSSEHLIAAGTGALGLIVIAITVRWLLRSRIASYVAKGTLLPKLVIADVQPADARTEAIMLANEFIEEKGYNVVPDLERALWLADHYRITLRTVEKATEGWIVTYSQHPKTLTVGTQPHELRVSVSPRGRCRMA